MKTPKRILVVATRRIGDVLLSTPLIRSLKRAWPAAEIDALVFADTASILAHNPDLHRVLTVPERPGFGAHLRFALSLARRYDLAVSTLPGDRPTVYAWLAGRHRIGLLEVGAKHRWKQRLLSAWVPFDNLHTHTVLMQLRLADLLGIARVPEVVVAWTGKDEERVQETLPFEVATVPFAVLHLYPKFAYKTWHAQGWAALAAWLEAQGMRVVVTGGSSPEEARYIASVRAQLSATTIDLSGKLTLAQAGFLLSRARLYVGPDTAMTHMAAALGIPTVSLYGPSNPVKWAPWPRGYDHSENPFMVRGTQRQSNVALVQGAGTCVPCMQEGCDRHIDSLSDCLQQLAPETVIAAAREALANG